MVQPSASQQQHLTYMATDSSSSGSQRLRSGSETPTAAATARRPSAFSVLSSASSSAGSWSRASAASTDQSFPSRTSSNAAFVPRPSSPNRDSFISIVDDPFFQHLDSLDSPASVVPDSYKPIEFESETLAEIPFFSPETSRSNTSRYDHEGQQKQHWPPPRRESLTIGSSQFWVGYAWRMKKLHKEKMDKKNGKSQDIDCPCQIQLRDKAPASTQLERHGVHEFDATLQTGRPILSHAHHLTTTAPVSTQLVLFNHLPLLGVCRGAANQGFTPVHLGYSYI